MSAKFLRKYVPVGGAPETMLQLFDSRRSRKEMILENQENNERSDRSSVTFLYLQGKLALRNVGDVGLYQVQIWS